MVILSLRYLDSPSINLITFVCIPWMFVDPSEHHNTTIFLNQASTKLNNVFNKLVEHLCAERYINVKMESNNARKLGYCMIQLVKISKTVRQFRAKTEVKFLTSCSKLTC